VSGGGAAQAEADVTSEIEITSDRKALCRLRLSTGLLSRKRQKIGALNNDSFIPSAR
jgi:hypothetical protein